MSNFMKRAFWSAGSWWCYNISMVGLAINIFWGYAGLFCEIKRNKV